MRRLMVFLWGMIGLWLGLADAAWASWSRARSANFEVYSSRSPQDAANTALRLERFRALLMDLTGQRATDPSPRLKVFLMGTPGQLAQVRPGLPQSVAGFYRADVEQVAAFALSGLSSLASREQGIQILQHEYAHHFMFQYAPDAYPAWYVEGFAEYVATADLDEEEAVVGRAAQWRVQSLFSDTPVSWSDLVEKRRSDIRQNQIGAYYAQSWLLTHFLMSKPAHAKALPGYLRNPSSPSPGAAFQASFALDFNALDKALDAYKRAMPYMRFTLKPAFETPIQTETLSQAASEAVLVEQRVLLARREEAGALAEARRLAERFPTAPEALRTLARAEIALGDPAAARAPLAAYAAARPDDPDGPYLEAMSHLGRGPDRPGPEARAAARAAFVRAFKLDPDHVPTLFDYARMQAEEPGGPSDAVIDVLIRAHQRAPQVSAIRLRLADMVFARGRHADAIHLLEPLAMSPHGGEASRRAELLLTRVRAAALGAEIGAAAASP